MAYIYNFTLSSITLIYVQKKGQGSEKGRHAAISRINPGQNRTAGSVPAIATTAAVPRQLHPPQFQSIPTPK